MFPACHRLKNYSRSPQDSYFFFWKNIMSLKYHISNFAYYGESNLFDVVSIYTIVLYFKRQNS